MKLFVTFAAIVGIAGAVQWWRVQDRPEVALGLGGLAALLIASRYYLL